MHLHLNQTQSSVQGESCSCVHAVSVCGTCYHEALQGQVGSGRNVNLLTATAEEVLLFTTPVHGCYAELATSAKEIKRPSQLLQHSPDHVTGQGRAGQGRAGQGRGQHLQHLGWEGHQLCKATSTSYCAYDAKLQFGLNELCTNKQEFRQLVSPAVWPSRQKQHQSSDGCL